MLMVPELPKAAAEVLSGASRLLTLPQVKSHLIAREFIFPWEIQARKVALSAVLH